MNKLKILLIMGLILGILPAQEKRPVPTKKWVRRVIRQPDNPPRYSNYSPGEIVIGDARNDGVTRLYCANLNKDVVEYSWENNTWVARTILQGPNLTGMVIGKARATDNLNRLYAHRAHLELALYEISYENGNWVMREIPLAPEDKWICSVIPGQGRNDGINRLYISTEKYKTYELKFDGNNWIVESIVSSHVKVGSLGDGRGDGINRLYGVAGDSLFEITYTQNGWQENLIGIWPNPQNFFHPIGGFAPPDLYHFGFIGPMIIVKSIDDRTFYSYKYNSETNSWEVKAMHPYYPRYLYGMSYGFFYPFDVMQDPRTYLFKKNFYAPIYPEDVEHGDTIYIHEFSYNPSTKTWTRKAISYITVNPGALSCLKCGNIRGKNCIYAISEDGTIVEISYE